MTRRRRRVNPLSVILLFVVILGGIYVTQVVVPNTPPLFIPTPTATRAPESYVAEAQSLEKEGKYAQAIQSYSLAIKVSPNDPANYVSLARLQIYLGEYEKAIENAGNALLINENNSTAYALRGWGLTYTGKYLEAESAFQRAIALDPNNGVAYALLAEMQVQQINDNSGTLTTLDSAIENSHSAERLSPDAMETHRARGLVLEITQNNQEAIDEFEKAIAINPFIADMHLWLGRNYRALDFNIEAVDEYNKAIVLNPSDPIPYVYIARTYAAIGEYANAVSFAEQAVKVAPDDAFYYGTLGVMQKAIGRYVDAVTNLRLAVRGGVSEDGHVIEGIPMDYEIRTSEFYYSYAIALARIGECGEALQLAQAIQQNLANDSTAVYNADEVVNICQELLDSGGAATTEPEVTPTP